MPAAIEELWMPAAIEELWKPAAVKSCGAGVGEERRSWTRAPGVEDSELWPLEP